MNHNLYHHDLEVLDLRHHDLDDLDLDLHHHDLQHHHHNNLHHQDDQIALAFDEEMHECAVMTKKMIDVINDLQENAEAYLFKHMIAYHEKISLPTMSV